MAGEDDVTIKVAGDVSAILAALQQLNAAFDATQKAMVASLQATGNATKDLPTNLENAATKGTFAGQMMVKVFDSIKESVVDAAKALPDMVMGAAALGEQLHQLSSRTDLSVETLSQFKYIASQTGTSLEMMARTVGDMGKKLEAGSGTTQAAVARLGLSFDQLQAEDPGKAFIDIMDALGKMPTAAERATTGTLLFGNKFRQISQLSKEDLQGLADKAKALGLEVSTTDADAAVKFNAALSTMNQMMDSTKDKIGFALLDPLTKVLNLAPNAGGALLLVGKGFAGLGKDALDAAGNLVPLIANWEKVAKTSADAVGWMKTSIPLFAPMAAGIEAMGAAAATATIAVGPLVVALGALAAQGAILWQLGNLQLEHAQRVMAQRRQDTVDAENLIRLNKAMGTSYDTIAEAAKHYADTHKATTPPKVLIDGFANLTAAIDGTTASLDKLTSTSPGKIADISNALKRGVSVGEIATSTGLSPEEVGLQKARDDNEEKRKAQAAQTQAVLTSIGKTGLAASLAQTKAATDAAIEAAKNQVGSAKDQEAGMKAAREQGAAELSKITSDARMADAAEDRAVRAQVEQQRIQSEETGLAATLDLIKARSAAEIDSIQHSGDTAAEIARKVGNARIKAESDTQAALATERKAAADRAIALEGEQVASEIKIHEDGIQQQIDLLDAGLSTQLKQLEAHGAQEDELNKARVENQLKKDEILAAQAKQQRNDEITAQVADQADEINRTKIGLDKTLALEQNAFDERLRQMVESKKYTQEYIDFVIAEEQRKVQGIKDADAGIGGTVEARAEAAGFLTKETAQHSADQAQKLRDDMVAKNKEMAQWGLNPMFDVTTIDAATAAYKKAKDAIDGTVSAESAGYKTKVQLAAETKNQHDLYVSMSTEIDENTGKLKYNSEEIDKQRQAWQNASDAEKGNISILGTLSAGLDMLSSKMSSMASPSAKAAGGIASIGSSLVSAKLAADKSGLAFGSLSTAFDGTKSSTERMSAGISSGMGIASGAMDVFASYSATASKGVNTLNGAMAGAKAGAQFGPWGAAIGAAAGALTNFIRSLTAGRKAVEDFAKTQGGFDELHAKLSKLGDQGEKLWVTLTQGTNKGDPKQAAANIALVTKALDDNAAAITKLNAAQNTQLQGLLAIAPVYDKLPDDVAQYVDQLTQAGLITQQNADQLKALGADGPDTWQRMKSEADKYGISLDSLGPKFQQQQLTAQATDIIKTFDDLTKNGADFNGVLAGMSDEISGIAQNSLKFGTEIPGNMKPWMEQLAASGQLLDENGNKITDISGMNFGANITVGLGDVVSKLQEMIDLMKNGLPKAVDQTSSAFAESGKAAQDFGEKGVKAATDVQAAVDGVSFGHSPGGLKEWVPMFKRSQAAAAEFSSQFVKQLTAAQDAVDSLDTVVQPSISTDAAAALNDQMFKVKVAAQQADQDASAAQLQSVMNSVMAQNAGVHLAEGAIQIDRPILKDKASMQDLALEVSKQLSAVLRPSGAWVQ